MTLQERLLMIGIMLLFIVPGFMFKSCEAADTRGVATQFTTEWQALSPVDTRALKAGV